MFNIVKCMKLVSVIGLECREFEWFSEELTSCIFRMRTHTGVL